jgi:AcrR family transcriptional regulator
VAEGRATRRAPQQRRSADKVEAILRAARALLTEDGSVFDARSLADRAGVSVATVYRYFATLDQVVDVVLVEHADRAEELVARTLTDGVFRSVADVFGAILDAYIGLYRERPEFMRLLADPRLAARQRDTEWASDRGLARLLAGVLADRGLRPAPTEEDLRRLEVQWTAAGAVLGLAFRVDPAGDEAILDELRAMVRGFAGARR